MEIKATKKATSAIFLVCGLGISSWAPMVPDVKQRLHLNDASLVLLLFLLGGGAIVIMPVTGMLIHRFGSRIVILCASVVMALMLPLLLLLASPLTMGFSLFIFGSAVGTVDVAMNAHGIQVQNKSGTTIMSSLYGLFSTGGLLGSLGFLMKLGLAPITAAISIAILLISIVSWSYRFLLNSATGQRIQQEFSVNNASGEAKISKSLSWFKGPVIFLGLLCFAVFLSEGAMLDWSAVFLREDRQVEEDLAGVGYAAYSVAMAAMRLLGDRIVSRLDGRTVVLWGGLLAAGGLFIVVATPWVATSLLGFVLLGVGATNIVPVFFSESGKIKNVPAYVAIPTITTMGYAGQLVGPVFLGFIAFRFSLSIALAFSGSLLLLVALAYSIKQSKESVGQVKTPAKI